MKTRNCINAISVHHDDAIYARSKIYVPIYVKYMYRVKAQGSLSYPSSSLTNGTGTATGTSTSTGTGIGTGTGTGTGPGTIFEKYNNRRCHLNF